MIPSILVREMRGVAQLSTRRMADAAGIAASTVHRIEHGQLNPTVETLRHLGQAAGYRLEIDAKTDYAASVSGLARCIRAALDDDDTTVLVRMAAEFVRRFEEADNADRHRMITAEPAGTGSARWDAFVGALVEWVAVKTRTATPNWVWADKRYLNRSWWVSSMASMRAWEFAGSPASFQTRGIFIHRESLTNV